jgi:hypothetical protein
MARGGFYAIQSSEIRFGRDGRWYADGEPIANRRIADLFSRHVRRDPQGGYVLRIGPETASIVVEDTPYVVIGTRKGRGGGIEIELNDGSVEALDADSLRLGPDDVLYCRVKKGAERARFLRPAFHQVARYIEETRPGIFVLRLGGRAHPIASL